MATWFHVCNIYTTNWLSSYHKRYVIEDMASVIWLLSSYHKGYVIEDTWHQFSGFSNFFTSVLGIVKNNTALLKNCVTFGIKSIFLKF